MKFRISVFFFIFVLLLLYFLKAAWFLYLIAFLVFSFITFLGVVNMDFHWFLKSYIHNPTVKERKIAITFDDGPTQSTPKFLELLKNFDQKATFFCIGKQIEKHPQIFKQIIADGHEIGNHSFSHGNNTGFLSTQKMMEEIKQNDLIIFEKGNIKTNLYRPPFGIINPNIAKAIQKSGKKSIGWNIRSFDTAIKDEEKILNRILPNINSGSVILLHDTSEKSFRVLEQILLFLQRENYRSVTVSEIFDFDITNYSKKSIRN